MIVVNVRNLVDQIPLHIEINTKFKFAGFVPQPTSFFDWPQKSKQKMALKFTPAAGRRPT